MSDNSESIDEQIKQLDEVLQNSLQSSSGIDHLPEDKRPRNVSISTEKPLFQFNADNPQIYYTTLREIWSSKEQVATKLADPLKKAIPIVVIMAALMGFVLLISNIPQIIDAVAKYTKTPPVTEKVEIVYLTPEEAKARGIAVPEQPQNTPPVQPTPTPAPTQTPTTDNERLSILDIEKQRPDAIGSTPAPEPAKPGFGLIPNINLPQQQPLVREKPVQPEPTPQPTPTPEPTPVKPANSTSNGGFNKPTLLPP